MKENENLKSELNRVKHDYESLLMENNSLKLQLVRFKEMEIKYNELKVKYNKLNNLNDNEKDCWKEWDVMDVVNWIISLDQGRYIKYKQVLMNNLRKEEIDGSCLSDIDKNDLHRFGVTSFKDKGHLCAKLKQLTS